jgi:hypothetical protein
MGKGRYTYWILLGLIYHATTYPILNSTKNLTNPASLFQICVIRQLIYVTNVWYAYLAQGLIVTYS